MTWNDQQKSLAFRIKKFRARQRYAFCIEIESWIENPVFYTPCRFFVCSFAKCSNCHHYLKQTKTGWLLKRKRYFVDFDAVSFVPSMRCDSFWRASLFCKIIYCDGFQSSIQKYFDFSCSAEAPPFSHLFHAFLILIAIKPAQQCDLPSFIPLY